VPKRAAEIVDDYLEAVSRRDFVTARGYLADRGFEYVSPIARFNDPDLFFENMHGVGAILHRLDTRLRFSEGNDVCHVLDVTISMDGYDMQSVVQLAQVRDGRIVRLEVIFDASDFHRMIGDQKLE